MIYILANANAVSGGPELLHQLCNKLIKSGFEASILYFCRTRMPTQKLSAKLVDAYERYQCPIAEQCIDIPENVVIFPETILFFLPKFKHVRKVIWWQSVNNYFQSLHSKYARFYAPFGMHYKKFSPFLPQYYHCYQSQYAKEFLIGKKVTEDRMFPLSDYLSREFLAASENEASEEKRDVVLYNPRKGHEFTQKLMGIAPNIEWRALQNLNRDEMVHLMTRSKVYIDFGDHPGKDRIPREAAICGCCVITGRRGSAKNDIDIPIPGKYKFYDDQEERVIDCIIRCFDQYDVIRKDFDTYRMKIRQEEEVFDKETEQIGRILSSL